VGGMCQTMNRGWIAAAGQDGASRVLAEPRDPKMAVVQRYSRIVLADLCVTSAPEMGTNRYQRDVG
jgi:hypothetical protein